MRDPELRHRVLRLTGRLFAVAPLVIAECEEDDGDDHGDGDDEAEVMEDDDEAAATLLSTRRANGRVRVVMQRACYERVSCRSGADGGTARFVIFAPWYEQKAERSAGGVQLLLAPLAEAL